MSEHPQREIDTEAPRIKPIEEIVRYEVNYSFLAAFLVGVGTIAGLVFVLTHTSKQNGLAIITEAPTEEVATIPYIDSFENISLEGKAAYVLDVNSGEAIFANNEETQLPLASITKLMTIVAASEYVEPEESIVIEYGNLNEEGDSGLLANEVWNAKDLFDFTLIVSSNDGADALATVAGAAKLISGQSNASTAEGAFVEEMNEIAQEINLTQTYFLNETGLDPNTVTSGGYGSARDVAHLLGYLVTHKPHLIEATAVEVKEFTSDSQFVHVATNTNDAIANIPALIASKTGFTDLAGGNLVIAFDAGINRPIVVAVLGSSKEGRFSDVEKLVTASINHFSQSK